MKTETYARTTDRLKAELRTFSDLQEFFDLLKVCLCENSASLHFRTPENYHLKQQVKKLFDLLTVRQFEKLSYIKL